MKRLFKILLINRMCSRIIYVLCYDDESEKKANAEFSQYPWARIYRIPVESQNHLFEGVMYQTELMKSYHEWKDKEFVGTISYKLKDRFHYFPFRTMEFTGRLISNVDSKHFDVIPFMPYIGAKFDMLTQDLKNMYMSLCDRFFPLTIRYLIKKAKVVTREVELAHDNFFFFNYWMTTPARMLEYIDFFNLVWIPTLESNQTVWNNSGYKGNLTTEQLKKLTKRVDYYPYHPFINERLPASYFRYKKARIHYGS